MTRITIGELIQELDASLASPEHIAPGVRHCLKDVPLPQVNSVDAGILASRLRESQAALGELQEMIRECTDQPQGTCSSDGRLIGLTPKGWANLRARHAAMQFECDVLGRLVQAFDVRQEADRRLEEERAAKASQRHRERLLDQIAIDNRVKEQERARRQAILDEIRQERAEKEKVS